MRLRLYIHSFLGTSIFIDMFYIYGIAGSLETDFITMRQAIIRGSIACVYMAFAVILYNRFSRKESTRLSKKKFNRHKENDRRGIWQKLKEDQPILNEVIHWGVTIMALLAVIKSFIR